MSDREVFMDRLLGAATSHGDEELDQELGDLQMLLLEAVEQMSAEQFEQFKASQAVQDVMAFEGSAEEEMAMSHEERLASEIEDEDSAYVTLGDDVPSDENPFFGEDAEDD